MAGITPYKVGDVFGYKKIVEYCGADPKHRVSLWKYECTLCGKINGPVRTGTLTRKDREDSVPRCCYDGSRVKGNANPRWLGYNDLPQSYFNQIRDGASKRSKEFAVTIEDMWAQWEIQDGRCAYTGRVLTLGYKNTDASLDRKDNTKGYVVDNIQWVHKDINRMKNDMSEEAFLSLCRDVALNT